MSRPRYLTKSRFALALECPTKLFYSNKNEYPNKKLEDPFLEALAEGGYQIGELARQYYPEGIKIESLDHEAAVKETLEQLKKDKVVLFEAAIKYKNLFVRVDILIKNKDHLDLIEVKAKSFDKSEDESFFNKREKKINSGWAKYLLDIAFQRFVLERAYPELKIDSYLYLVDKNKLCPSDELNQKLRLVGVEGERKIVQVTSPLTKEEIKNKILTLVPVDEYIDHIFDNYGQDSGTGQPFEEMVFSFADSFEKDLKIPPVLSKECSGCEFSCTSEEEAQGLKSGFKECWKSVLNWKDADFEQDLVLDLWRFGKKNDLLAQGVYKLIDVEEEDVNPKPRKDGAGLSQSERQWVQVEKARKGEKGPYFDGEKMKQEMESWTYPLHFIDFETIQNAIPFVKGRRPYEQIAFQFSHHMVDESGQVYHAGQYINTKRGHFPNFEFVRKLKEQLDQDEGTIFRYAPHENTVLNQIYKQLQEEEEHITKAEKEDLCAFIRSITKSTGKSTEKWEGKRSMVDMRDLVIWYYYDPQTKGSNSLKAVLPAMLNSSSYLQEKYGRPIYGTPNGIQSLNFENWQWIQKSGGKVTDPYQLLPKLFKDIDPKELEKLQFLTTDEDLADGGAAMTAYARMQFTEMSECERQELERALLKYCELDTLAMVMLYEGWKDWVDRWPSVDKLFFNIPKRK